MRIKVSWLNRIVPSLIWVQTPSPLFSVLVLPHGLSSLHTVLQMYFWSPHPSSRSPSLPSLYLLPYLQPPLCFHGNGLHGHTPPKKKKKKKDWQWISARCAVHHRVWPNSATRGHQRVNRTLIWHFGPGRDCFWRKLEYNFRNMFSRAVTNDYTTQHNICSWVESVISQLYLPKK